MIHDCALDLTATAAPAAVVPTAVNRFFWPKLGEFMDLHLRF